jgi:hypothetical protein
LALASVAANAGVNSRISEAEAYAERSIKILEMDHAANDPILLWPLEILMSANFEHGKVAKSRRVFQKMQRITPHRPQDRALVHNAAARLFQYEGKLKEAETELLAAIRAWEDTGQTRLPCSTISGRSTFSNGGTLKHSLLSSVPGL